jgi:heptaprenyl diphosphate synthase component I
LTESGAFRLTKAKQLTILALFAVTATAVSGLELLIPMDFVIPGIKLGLSNIVILLVIYRFGAKCGVAVTCFKAMLSSLLFGGFTTFLYSFSGAVLSGIAMGLVYRKESVTPVGASLLGAAVHITAQVLCALLLLKSVYVLCYYPFVLFSGTLCGALNGIIVKFIRDKYRLG